MVALDGAGASFLGDLFFEFLDDEAGRVPRLARELLVQGGHALLLDAEGLR